MADFKPQDFLSGDITATKVEKLKKKELILVAKELDVKFTSGRHSKSRGEGSGFAGTDRMEYAKGYIETC